MGSPLAPILANLFMEKLENEHILIPQHGQLIKTWIRYVDDILIIVNGCTDDVLVLLNNINSIHPNIKFTVELEKDNKLAFLDVLIEKHQDHLETSVYGKKTCTHLYMKWDSCNPKYQKIALIKSLITRAIRICSGETLLNAEINWIKTVLHENGYPAQLLERSIKTTFERYTNNILFNLSKNADKSQSIVEGNVCFYYLGNESRQFVSNTKRTLIKYGITNIRFGFRKYQTIDSAFSHKYKGKDESKVGVVYCIECNDCANIYVGQTGNEIDTRIDQHKKTLNKVDPNSKLFVHATEDNHTLELDKPCVLAYERNEIKRLLKNTLITYQHNNLTYNDISLKTVMFN
ncbi:unnamed protein product [Didymodactylos carnosus]|uniref:Reverse transcriptase domain-containing protein n=1 Tax=Didymodactylos carnosus TaxID=1234261 RepID=A0A815CAF2_9BILA|nr:unnamed protein product [Didymodactylos carnosus]CAF1336701.1 unnamed protein product [Didymodactylos carnosus]CAF4079085.1 unnamed protein product [Didymodactylos carnosus]CAF4147977.1 unnamed protein product [Didymodactylos carnosus]